MFCAVFAAATAARSALAQQRQIATAKNMLREELSTGYEHVWIASASLRTKSLNVYCIYEMLCMNI